MRHKTNIFLIGILALVIIALLAGYIFLFFDVRSKNESASSLQNELATEIKQEKYAVSMDRMIKGADENINIVNSSIVPSDGDVAFIEYLESLARAKGLSVEISSLNIENSTLLTANKIVAFRIKAQIKGKWLGTYAFLSSLESLPFKIKINSFSLTNQGNSQSDGKSATTTPIWQSSFDITVLKYK